MADPKRNTNYMVIIHCSNDGNGGKPITITAPMPPEVAFDMANTYEAPFAQGLIQDQTMRNIAGAFGVRAATPSMTAQIWQGTSEQDLSVDLEFHTETDPLTDVRQPMLDLLMLVTPGVVPATGMLRSPGPSLEASAKEIGALAGDAAGVLVGAITAAVKAAIGVNPPQFVDKMLDTSASTLAANGGATTNAPQTPQGLGTTAFWKKRIKNQISLQIGNYMFFDSVVITGARMTFLSAIDPSTGWPHHLKVSVSFKPMFNIIQDDLPQIFITKPSGVGNGAGGVAGSLLGLFL